MTEVAVIAGTPYDAQLGVDLLRAKGIPGTAYPMAASPDEQDALQYLGPDALNDAWRKQLHDIAGRGTRLAMLFCNSLSAVVDVDAVAGSPPVTVISPVTVYRQLPPDLGKIMVLTGNGQAIVGFERTVMASRSRASRVLGVSDPALVRAIERGDPVEAFSSSHLPATLRLAGQLGLDAVVLGCTHFTAIAGHIEAACPVRVVDVGASLVALVGAAVAAGPTPAS